MTTTSARSIRVMLRKLRDSYRAEDAPTVFREGSHVVILGPSDPLRPDFIPSGKEQRSPEPHRQPA